MSVAGFHFSVRVKPVEEVRRAGESPVDYVRRLAQAKAEAAWEGADEIVLGADTTVAMDNHVLEKPADADDARAMLRLLSGREHTVVTGICMVHNGRSISDHASTQVQFAPLNGAEIESYIHSGEAAGKAGAYAIQGLASKFVERIDGCYFNVMGLPLSLVYRHWKALT